MVRALLATGADRNLRDAKGNTALIIAASKASRGDNEVAIVVALLEAGADPLIANNDGETALDAALSGIPYTANSVRIVKALLDAGADPNRLSPDNTPPINWVAFAARADAAEYHAQVLEALLEAGADPNVRRLNGNTALVTATELRFDRDEEAGLLRIVRTLLDAGADPNVRVREGKTALSVAVAKNSTAVVSALLEAGADPSVADDKGLTPLMRAARANNLDVVNALLAAGADPRAQTERGRTAMDYVHARTEAGQQIRAALQKALEQPPAASAQAAPEPAAPTTQEASPSSAPGIQPDPGRLAGLNTETYVGGMQSRGMKLYGLSSSGTWCAPNVIFKVVAGSESVYSDGTFTFFMRRFGERINEEQFCPAARSAEVYGFTGSGGEPVFTGTTSAATGWSMN